jgi:hypothetical protein
MGLALALLVPFSLISAACGWRWTLRLQRIGLPGWTALVCLLLGLMLVGWRGRAERFVAQQRIAGPPARVCEAQEAGGADLLP